MGTLTTLLSEQIVQHIGWTLLHFLWQGTIVMALTWCVLKILSNASSNTRYVVACVGLALMVMAPIITFALINSDSTLAPVPETAMVRQEISVPQPTAETRNIVIVDEKSAPSQRSVYEMLTARIEAALPGCVTGWLIGVIALSLWYLGGWCQLQRLRRIGTKTVPDALAQTTAELVRSLGIQRAVRIAESALVQVPTVIGHLKPIILLPASALTGLDEIQLKAMIAHELAHIHRCDYLVNIAQTVIEILGFYHPGVWWISRQVRIERENACDDSAIQLVQNRKQYAKALFSMEAVRSKQHDLAIAANGAPLTNRISRIVDKNANQNTTSGWIPSVAAALILLILIASVSLAARQNTSNDPAAAMMDKQKIAAFLKDFEQAVQDGDRQTVEQHLYFENNAIRQKAQPYITDMLNDDMTFLTDFHIIRIDRRADNSLSVFGLYLVQRETYLPYTLRMIIENGQYKLYLFNADFFEKIERTKSQTPQQIGRNIMQEQLDKWRNADRDELNKLIQTLIDQEENNLAAAQYAKANNLQIMPHFSIPEITQRLNLYKNTDPEQLRRQVIEECTKTLNDEKNPQPKSSKVAAKPASKEDKDAEMMAVRLDSMQKLRKLGIAYFCYLDDNNQTPPSDLKALQPYLDNETVPWLVENVILLKINKMPAPADIAITPIAYDKTLSATQNGTTILYADGHVEFRLKDTLEKILPVTQQVAIEARFIYVDKKFLKDIGIENPEHITGQVTEGLVNTPAIRTVLESKPLPERTLPFDNFQTLDDKLTSIVIRAVQGYASAKTLTAPKVCVLNGEPAQLEVKKNVRYLDIDDQEKDVSKGITLDILPVIQNDGKEILLKARAVISGILETRTQQHNGAAYDIPYMQVTEIPVHTMVDNQKTILIVGPELKTEQKDGETVSMQKRRLLILLKPTVIEHEEAAPLPARPAGGMGSFGGGFSYDQLPGIPKEE